ncbi:hypothetical protein SAMN02745165_01508 [Malonomonas rubra DSM 5091]|uniref:WYL domain-containing protein n=1 Tax=Malonomonas rubra DSM 5091 TaxID=1122189 RepID=A0A1M6GDR8_MALRU|nr:hypothetical protein [Malonomonas rubra]SHJ08019.1 hypothetical protein SAMN02745165_01508 [Malonomonas rubra DSM 5091]
MNFTELISQAGRQRRTVRLTFRGKVDEQQVESAELEPYNTREFGGKVSLFCLDVERCVCLNVDLASIIDAEITNHSFKPRFPVAF